MPSREEIDRHISNGEYPCYRYRALDGHQACELVASGRWDLPDFQRGFVWRPAQVRDLVDSLWRGYPIGHLLVWERNPDESAVHRPAWIADGQQRMTALCLMFGKRPPWWNRRAIDRANRERRFDLRFDVEASAPPFFHCSFDRPPEDPRGQLLELSEILAHDPASETGMAALGAIAQRVKQRGLCRSLSDEDVHQRLQRVSAIRRMPLCATTLDGSLDDVLEVFERLNSRGMRFRRLLLHLVMRSLTRTERRSVR